MGDNPDSESSGQDFGHGQAGAVDGDGSFFDDVFHQGLGWGDFKAPILTDLFPAMDFSETFDVTGDHVSIEASVGLERAFEVDEGVRLQVLEVGFLPGFQKKVHSDDSATLRAGKLGRCQAAAIDRQTIAELKISTGRSCLDLHANTRFGLGDLFDGSCFFNDASKHDGRYRGWWMWAVRRRSGPSRCQRVLVSCGKCVGSSNP